MTTVAAKVKRTTADLFAEKQAEGNQALHRWVRSLEVSRKQIGFGKKKVEVIPAPAA